jgi:hypothetical protein
MLRENGSAVVVDLDLPGAGPSGSFEPEVDASDAGEQAPEGRHVTASPDEAGNRSLPLQSAPDRLPNASPLE